MIRSMTDMIFLCDNFTQNKQKTKGTLNHRVELNYVNYNPPKETIILQIQTFKIIDFELCNLIQLGQRKNYSKIQVMI